MKPSSIAICITVLGLAITQPSLGNDAEKGWMTAPTERIGSRLEDWIEYYGPDYSIQELKSLKNTHTGDAMVAFWITDGSTTAKFMVDLVTNDHFLIEVESVSDEFLSELGIDKIPLDEHGNALLTDHWDAGMNRLRVRKEGEHHLAAVWNYYWD